MPDNDGIKITTNLIKLVSFIIACIILISSIIGFGIKYGQLTTKFEILQQRVEILEGERNVTAKDINEIKVTVGQINTKVDMLMEKK